MLSNEQHCLWGCGNAFFVSWNHNLKEKKPLVVFLDMYLHYTEINSSI